MISEVKFHAESIIQLFIKFTDYYKKYGTYQEAAEWYLRDF